MKTVWSIKLIYHSENINFNIYSVKRINECFLDVVSIFTYRSKYTCSYSKSKSRKNIEKGFTYNSM